MVIFYANSEWSMRLAKNAWDGFGYWSVWYRYHPWCIQLKTIKKDWKGFHCESETQMKMVFFLLSSKFTFGNKTLALVNKIYVLEKMYSLFPRRSLPNSTVCVSPTWDLLQNPISKKTTIQDEFLDVNKFNQPFGTTLKCSYYPLLVIILSKWLLLKVHCRKSNTP